MKHVRKRSFNVDLVLFFFCIVPGPVDPPTVGETGSDTAVLTWSPPSDPNGIILEYRVQYTAIDFAGNVFDNRRKRQVVVTSDDVLECIEFLNTTTVDVTITLTSIPGSQNTITLTGLS